jgi:hypothetical protein
MKRLLGLVFGAVMGIFTLGGGQASAAPIDLGTLTIGGSAAGFTLSSTDFGPSQDYSFHLDTAAAIFASASALMSATTGASAMSININPIGAAGGPTSATLNSLDFPNSVLSAGDYIMSVAALKAPGAASVFIGGFIAAVDPSLASTPIPATGVMMLTALAALGFLVRRRKQTGAAFGTAAI